MLAIEIVKLHLIWLRPKPTTKPENGLHCPNTPHGINGASSLSTLWLSNFHMSPNHLQGLLTQIAGPHTQSLRFSRSVVSVKNWHVLKVPRWCWWPVQGPHFENNYHWASHTKKQWGRKRGGKTPQAPSSCLRISCQCSPSAKHNQKPEGKGVLPPGSQSSTEKGSNPLPLTPCKSKGANGLPLFLISRYLSIPWGSLNPKATPWVIPSLKSLDTLELNFVFCPERYTTRLQTAPLAVIVSEIDQS